MFERTIAVELKNRLSKFPIVTLTGPRQSGKTTLLKNLYPNFKYLSLEDPDTRQYAESDPRGFLADYSEQVILDEIQRVPELFSYLQSHVDRTGKPGQFILSGSQNFLLLEQISQSLAGRSAILQLLPLSLRELSDAGRLPSKLESALYQGSYPRIYQNNLQPDEWYPSYIQTYLERDVRLLKNVGDLRVFQRFLQMCASRCGQLLNLSALANDCGITHNTAKSWVSLLEASFVIFLFQPHFVNIGKRLVKTPKLCFFDTGLVCSLLGIDSAEQLKTHYLRGGIFESFIISELIKIAYNSGKVPRYYFWRDKTGHEVDCLIDRAGTLSPVEIKSGKTISSDYFEGIEYWKNLSDAYRNSKATVIYGGDQIENRTLGQVLPWHALAKPELYSKLALS